MLFQRPLHPVNRAAHKHANADVIEKTTKLGRRGRRVSAAMAEQAYNPKKQCMPVRLCERRRRKRKGISNVKDSISSFIGQLVA